MTVAIIIGLGLGTLVMQCLIPALYERLVDGTIALRLRRAWQTKEYAALILRKFGPAAYRTTTQAGDYFASKQEVTFGFRTPSAIS